MSIEIPKFWQLLLESQLLSPEHCQQLGQEYGNVKGAAQQGNARTLAEWLVSRNVLSRYQATLLLAGRAGPFSYGEYKVYDRIENGRLAGLFRAVHGATGHPVLLSFLAGDQTDGNRLGQLAERVRSQFAVEHRHLHRCFELVDLPDFKFLVFEDLRGDPLESHVSAGRFSVADAAYIVRCAALGLAELHRHGLMHGDVRPHNIWLESSGNLRLLRDILRDPASYALSQSAPDDVNARADYLAPEMASGNRGGDSTTDIYGLGCTFYQLLAGKCPFTGASAQEKLSHHANSRIEPLEPLGVPQPVAQIVAYMMAKNPSVRYQDVNQVAEQLTPFADQQRMQSPEPPAPPSLGNFAALVHQRQSQQAAQAPAPLPAETATPQQPTNVGGFSFDMGNTSQPTEPAFDFGSKSTSPTTPKSADEATEAYRRKKEKTPKEMAIIFGGIAGLIILIIVGVQFLPTGDAGGEVAAGDGNDEPEVVAPDDDFMNVDLQAQQSNYEEPPQQGADQPEGSGSDTNAAAQADQGPQIVEVADDGETLWAPPTTGEPIDFAYVPPGGQLFFIARPADMLASPEGARVLESLGARFDAIRANWETTAGVKLDEIEQVIVSLHDNNDQFPRSVSVVHLQAAKPFDQLLASWGNPPELKPNSSLYSVGSEVIYLPPDAGGKVFVIGSREEVTESAEFNGASPPLRREIEKLRQASVSSRHFTMLFAPNYLFSGGRAIFTGPWKKLLDPIDQFLGDGLQAVMVGMQFGEEFYVEAELISDLGTDPGELAGNMRDRLEKIPNAMENYVVSLNPHPYWKRLALRYPQMIRVMHRYTRVGAEGDHAVINSVMPAQAAHNIVKASELALVSTPGDMTAMTSGGGASNNKPATLDDAMNAKLSLSIPQTSLEFAMRDLANDVNETVPGLDNFDIVIIGTDLQLNGITRNQQIRDFEIENKPVSEVLTALCMKANPVPNITDPTVDDQKLLWVIGPHPDDASRKTVLITTRESAAKKNYTLPSVFQPK